MNNDEKYIKRALSTSSYREYILNIARHFLPASRYKKLRKLIYTPKLFFRDASLFKKSPAESHFFRDYIFNIMCRFIPASRHKKLRKLIYNPKLFFHDMSLLKKTSAKPSTPQKTSAKPSTPQKSSIQIYSIGDIKFFNTFKENINLKDFPLIVYWGNKDTAYVLSNIYKSYNIIFPEASATWAQCWYSLSKIITTTDIQNITFLLTDAPSSEITEFAYNHNITILNLSEGFLGGYPYPKGLLLSYTLDKDINSNTKTKTSFQNEKIRSLLTTIRDLEITQISTIFNPDIESIDIRGGILILGSKQQDSIWNITELAMLAAKEYPQKAIFLLPYAGNISHVDTARLERDNIKYTIITDINNFAQILKEALHIYTYDSPLGFDALIYGCPLTVLGTPFYAGYGLCDDRASNICRSTKMSLEELFYDIYINKQKYIYNTNDTYIDCFTAIIHTKYNILKNTYTALNSLSNTQFYEVKNSKYYICLFSPKHLQNAYKEEKSNILKTLPFEKLFAQKDIEIQYILGCYIFGQLKDLIFIPFILSNLAKFMHMDAYKKLENTIKKFNYSDNFTLKEGQRESKFYFKSINPKICNIKERSKDDFTPVSKKTYQNIYTEAFEDYTKRELESSWRQLLNILLSGCETQKTLYLLGEIYRLVCDINRAKELFYINLSFDEGWKNRTVSLRYIECCLLGKDVKEAFSFLTLYSGIHRPLGAIVPYIDVLNKTYNIYGCREGFVTMSCYGWNKGTVNNAAAYLYNRMPQKAFELLKEFTPDESTMKEYLRTYGTALILCGKVKESYEIFNKYLQTNTAREDFNYVLFYLASGFEDRFYLNEIFKKSLSLNIDVESGVKFRVAVVNHLIREAFYYYACGVFSGWKKKIPEDKFIFSPQRSPSKTTLVLLGDSMGEPLFFGGQLGNLMKYYHPQQLLFVGDARLEPFFRRTYKDLKYIPTSKMHRYVTEISSMDVFDRIPRIDMSNAITNEVMDYWHAADNICFVYGAFHKMLTTYTELPKNTRLQCDEDKVSYWKDRLKNIPKIKVGVCWRSFRETPDNKNYEILIEDLSPLLDNENIQLINLQYTGLNDQEASYIEQNYPEKLITLPEIDLLNDIDGSAAMIKALDAVVSIPNTIGTLSSSIGIDTYIPLISQPGYFVSDGLSNHSYFLEKAKLMCPEDFSCDKKNIVARITKDIERTFTKKSDI